MGETVVGGGWDAVAYDRLSDPQFAWGNRVLDRLSLRGDETVMDAGCGTGRLTALLLERLPRGRIVAVDASAEMLEQARRNLSSSAERVRFVHADLTRLDLDERVDVVVSTATFHWILDHDALFTALHRVLVPGGRLEAQCGGGPNLARLRGCVREFTDGPFAAHFADWQEPWLFATPDETLAQLRRVGFVDCEASLEPAPTHFDSAGVYRDFLEKVVIWPHLQRLPTDALREQFLDALVKPAGEAESFELDYWRLNIGAIRAPSST